MTLEFYQAIPEHPEAACSPGRLGVATLVPNPLLGDLPFQSRIHAWGSPSDGRMKPVQEERIIVIDPEIMNGMPCFRGTRVPFKNLIDYLEGGHSLGEFLRQFPTVTREMAVRSLEEGEGIPLLAKIA